MKVIVYHRPYGCDTGCCGHVVEIQYENGESEESFQFKHAGYQFGGKIEEPLEFAKRLVTEEFGVEHVKDLDWDNCNISNGDNC